MCETLDLISLCSRGRPHFIRFCFQLFQRLQEFSQAMQSRLGCHFAAISHFLLWVALLSTFSPSTTSRVYIAAERNVPRRWWRHSFYIWKELMNQPSLSSHFHRLTLLPSMAKGLGRCWQSQIPYTFIFTSVCPCCARVLADSALIK